MSVWERYNKEQREKYILFLQMYGALSNLFRQKRTNLIPHLDSKFQETIYAKTFKGEIVDIGNTPHDILSIFGDKRIGIGIKTWMNSTPSFQKVMQIKRYQNEINSILTENDFEYLAYTISNIRNERILSDYLRLGLEKDSNIYHYITRDEGEFTINESSYPLINLNNLNIIDVSNTSFIWTDGLKEYKYTYGDSQIWQKFDPSNKDTLILNQFKVDIIDNPFDFLINAYLELIETKKDESTDPDIIEVYLPLYSYRTKKVEEKSGLNAWNAAPKNKDKPTPRPLNEIYIPIPKKFHDKFPRFFTKDIDILDLWEERKSIEKGKEKPEVRFNIQLPNGKSIPGLITGDYMKNFQSGSLTEYDEKGQLYGQSALGQWLLVEVLGLKNRTVVTLDWLHKKETDSIRLWRNINEYDTINIDFAPVGAFEAFMNGTPILEE